MFRSLHASRIFRSIRASTTIGWLLPEYVLWFMYTYIYMCMYICICIFIRTSMYIYIYYVYIYIIYIYTQLLIRAFSNERLLDDRYLSICDDIYTYINVYIYICIYISIHIYIYIFTYAYICLYIHYVCVVNGTTIIAHLEHS